MNMPYTTGLLFCIASLAFAQNDQYWNATPNDVNNLLKSMKSKIDADYSMDIKSIAEIGTDPEENPILYRSGHYNFTYTPVERKKLREYLLAGGILLCIIYAFYAPTPLGAVG